MVDTSFWQGKKVLVTGHTGFKGTWMTMLLSSLGAPIIGYSLDSPSTPSMFDVVNGSSHCHSIHGDVSDYSYLQQTMLLHQPEIIFHMAAQPLVRKSYQDPIHTFQVNVLGTVHLLEAARHTPSVRVIINVTSDKCYENDGVTPHSFRELDRLGGHDPYSASKACAELVTASYRHSFMNSPHLSYPRVASVRAGNVIGGGDWAADRLVPDLIRCYQHAEPLMLRNPQAVRPWQHVLDPLHGYMLVAEKLWKDRTYADAWNFGPLQDTIHTAQDLVQMVVHAWGEPLTIVSEVTNAPYEAPLLTLDSSKAALQLGWVPKLTTQKAVEWSVQWYKQQLAGRDIEAFTLQQMDTFFNG